MPDKKSDEFKQPKWVSVNKRRFNEILSTITKTKNHGLKTSIGGREITLENAESLLKGMFSKKIDAIEF